MSRKVVYLDTETMRISDDVEGGWDNVQSFGVSMAVVYPMHIGMFGVYCEDSLSDMIKDVLADADLVVGFNLKHFDYQVLLPYSPGVNLYGLPTFDIFEHFKELVGANVSLNNISSNTLGIAKNGDPKDAPKLYWEGDITTLANYCIQDVDITRNVFRAAMHDKYLEYYDRNYKQLTRVDTSSWIDKVKVILNQ